MTTLPPRSTLFPYTTLFRSTREPNHRDRKHQLSTIFGRVSATLRKACGYSAEDRTERSEEHTSELQSQFHLVCRLLLEKKKTKRRRQTHRYQASTGELSKSA